MNINLVIITHKEPEYWHIVGTSEGLFEEAGEMLGVLNELCTRLGGDYVRHIRKKPEVTLGMHKALGVFRLSVGKEKGELTFRKEE